MKRFSGVAVLYSWLTAMFKTSPMILTSRSVEPGSVVSSTTKERG